MKTRETKEEMYDPAYLLDWLSNSTNTTVLNMLVFRVIFNSLISISHWNIFVYVLKKPLELSKLMLDKYLHQDRWNNAKLVTDP